MKAIDHLRKIRRIKKQRQRIEEEIARIRDEVTSVRAISYEPKIGVSGSLNTKSPQEKLVNKLAYLEEQLDKLEIEYMAHIEICNDLMSNISKESKEILTEHYIKLKTFEQIAKEKGYETDTIKLYNYRALKEYQVSLNAMIHYKSFPQS